MSLILQRQELGERAAKVMRGMPVPDIPLFITVDRYRMLRRIGQGARGVVYLAEDLRTSQKVAIKFLVVADDMSEVESHQRFEREARLLAQLRHPHLVRYEGAGKLPWRKLMLHYVAMEYLQGLRTLDVAMEEFGSADWFLDRTEELLLTLEFMHARPEPVIHRDLKPTNLGIAEDRRLRVLDLGLAHLSGSDLTNPGVFMGSLGYVSPEQV
ncbi:MAG TPA: serine/threonine-protein kinase, partial [Candidatus Xenobia bacterium]